MDYSYKFASPLTNFKRNYFSDLCHFLIDELNSSTSPVASAIPVTSVSPVANNPAAESSEVANVERSISLLMERDARLAEEISVTTLELERLTFEKEAVIMRLQVSRSLVGALQRMRDEKAVANTTQPPPHSAWRRATLLLLLANAVVLIGFAIEFRTVWLHMLHLVK
ncbi:hypothetical protein PQR34_44750 [Paraburkholderia sediminicola]|uniref:hypothetical protein n=1 Tax=Paraburkholderia sediminicola TaxID=458836 RepID=UPI0038BA1E91